MTDSLMKKLFETLPLAGVEGAFGGLDALEAASPSEIYPFLQWVPPGTVPGAVSAAPTDHGDKAKNQLELIWSLECTANPSEVVALDCAIRAHKFANVRVAESIRFGWEAPPTGGKASPILPHIRCTTASGAVIDLPLTNAFLFQTWQTQYGGVPSNRPLWRFPTIHDTGVVRVFVYDLPFVGTTLSPPVPIGTDSSAADKAEIQQLLAQCAKLGADSDDDTIGFGEALLGDHLLAPAVAFDTAAAMDLAAGAVSDWMKGTVTAIETGEVAKVMTGRVRVVVVCSVLCCRETNDFQPGSPAGVARIFPHVYVCSNAPWAFGSFESTIQVNRPEESSHRLGCHEMNKKIRATLVTDTNRDGRIQPTGELSVPYWGHLDLAEVPPLPLWSNLFNYYVASAEDSLGLQPLHVVDTNHTARRVKSGLIRRRIPSPVLDSLGKVPSPLGAASGLVAGALESDVLSKYPRQGEFDNVHLAPTMRLSAAAKFVGTTMRDADASADHLDEIAMAPLCTHDCFHMHWRWTDAGPGVAQMGWGARGPNSVPGATMVPPEQDVWIWLRSGAELSYHARHRERNWNGEWIAFCHHGAAILVELDSTMVQRAKDGVAAFSIATGWTMVDKSGAPVSPHSSLACFYWWNRYTITDDARVEETTQFIDLDGARRL